MSAANGGGVPAGISGRSPRFMTAMAACKPQEVSAASAQVQLQMHIS